MTTPLARSGPAAGRKGPQIADEPQNTRQKDGSRIRWNATEAFSFKKKGSLSRQASKLLVFFCPALVAAPLRREPNPPFPPLRRSTTLQEGNMPSLLPPAPRHISDVISPVPVTKRRHPCGMPVTAATLAPTSAPVILSDSNCKHSVLPSRADIRIWR
jgi:hypothetical protein